MGLKRFLKFSYILLLAITLTACTSGTGKKKTPGGGGEEIEETICTTHPSSEYCKVITENKRITRKDAKPIQRHWENEDIFLYWSDPLYSKGFQFTNQEYAGAGFSIDEGSILTDGTKFTTYFFSRDDGSFIRKGDVAITSIPILGGRHGFNISNTKPGDKIMSIAVFPDKTYLILPPIEIIA